MEWNEKLSVHSSFSHHQQNFHTYNRIQLIITNLLPSKSEREKRKWKILVKNL